MAMICPVCTERYDQRLQCPRCLVRLVPQLGVAPDVDDLAPHWSRSPWVRVALGVILAQGLFAAINHLLLAGILATGQQGSATQREVFGLLVVQALQVFTLLLGSILASAGQRNGMLYGSLVGVWNGIFSVFFQSLQGEPVTAVDFYGQPVLHTAFGAFGGLLGWWIWRPLPSFAPEATRPKASVFRPRSLFKLTEARPRWARIFAGVAIAVGGVIWAETILTLVIRASDGRMNIQSSLQERLITVEISTLAVFFGAGVAGAGTWQGSSQGAWVGLISASLLVGYRLSYGNLSGMSSIVYMLIAVLAWSFLGGLFGGRLLPPIPTHLKKYKPVPV